jgi:cytochrome P450
MIDFGNSVPTAADAVIGTDSGPLLPARKNLPRPAAPAPLEKPLGTLDLLGALRRNPLEAWTRAHFEKPLTLHDYRLGRIAVVSAPAAIRRVLLDNAQNYRKDDLQRRVLGRALHDGLLTAEGDDWRLQRRIIAPLFNMRAVADFAPAIREAASDLVTRWRRADGQVLDVAAEMASVALDVLIRTIFPDGLGDNREDWRTAMRDYFDTSGKIHPFEVLGLPYIVPRLRRSQSWSAFFDRSIERLIAARATSGGREDARDLLTLLVESRHAEGVQGLSERQIRANIFTFIAAGHETTANAITWALYLLTLSPEWRSEVEAEAAPAWDGPAAGLTERLPRTRAVIDEALRLYPPLAAISRVAIGPDRLAETAIEAGTLIVIAPYVLHRHRLLWDDPDVFDPRRFLAGAHGPVDRYAYLPFGAGPRVCIGAAFALQEALFILSAIVRNFSFDIIPHRVVWPLQRVTLRPRGGLPMRIRCHDCNKSSL